ncbi:hypothetical protein SUGI_0138520 [Cryptomeria japonica]|uniref:21 kDa protein n=1 Tax=Cryptomeria japonica TaxID=3369 RepID=UPI002408C6B5|nr:21 kDa protein [Cryptomeria japonica]GLJ10947.1 hypothetical protein SUGI_0138520 [Cryptomeria japonica]
MQSMKSSQKSGISRPWRGREVHLFVVCSIICVGIAFLPPTNALEAKEETGFEGTRSSDLIQRLCNKTLYFDVCNSSLSSYPRSDHACKWEFGRIAVELSLSEAQSVYDYILDLNGTGAASCAAIEDCVEVLDDMVAELNDCLSLMANRNWTESAEDVKTWLSAALTYPETCVEGFVDEGVEMPQNMKEKLEYLEKLTSNALAIATYLSDMETQKLVPDF